MDSDQESSEVRACWPSRRLSIIGRRGMKRCLLLSYFSVHYVWKHLKLTIWVFSPVHAVIRYYTARPWDRSHRCVKHLDLSILLASYSNRRKWLMSRLSKSKSRSQMRQSCSNFWIIWHCADPFAEWLVVWRRVSILPWDSLHSSHFIVLLWRDNDDVSERHPEVCRRALSRLIGFRKSTSLVVNHPWLIDLSSSGPLTLINPN